MPLDAYRLQDTEYDTTLAELSTHPVLRVMIG
jgi:hypothetical protein